VDPRQLKNAGRIPVTYLALANAVLTALLDAERVTVAVKCGAREVTPTSAPTNHVRFNNFLAFQGRLVRRARGRRDAQTSEPATALRRFEDFTKLHEYGACVMGISWPSRGEN
jgi:hypothetical protein